MSFEASNPVLNNVHIYNNTNGGWGGGSYFGSSNPIINNAVVSGNNSGGDGSGLAIRVSVVEMQNVTIADNVSTSSAGGIHLWGGSTLNMDHSILWNNSPNQV